MSYLFNVFGNNCSPEIKSRIYILLKENNINDDLNVFVLNASSYIESSINNKVISTLVYGDNTTNCEDEFVTEVLNGEVIVKYVDSENNELAESVKMTDLVGNDYITKAIAINSMLFSPTHIQPRGRVLALSYLF